MKVENFFKVINFETPKRGGHNKLKETEIELFMRPYTKNGCKGHCYILINGVLSTKLIKNGIAHLSIVENPLTGGKLLYFSEEGTFELKKDASCATHHIYNKELCLYLKKYLGITEKAFKVVLPIKELETVKDNVKCFEIIHQFNVVKL